MDFIIGLLNNNYVISILTGLMVYFITDLFTRVREKKNYLLKVDTVNKELFNIIKNCIPENNLPSPQILLSIHRSSARNQNVKIEDVDSLFIIFDDLIKEIMDSNFLSYENKINYCEKIMRLNQEVLNYTIVINEECKTTIDEDINFKPKISSLIAVALASVSTLVSLIATLFDEETSSLLLNTLRSSNLTGSIIFVLLILVVLTYILLYTHWINLKDQMRRNKEKTRTTDN